MHIDYLKRTRVAELRNNNYTIVGFGAGIIGLKTINFLDNPFHYFIDNSAEKIASGWKEYTDENIHVPIKHFNDIAQETNSKIAVIICSEHYESMAKQLLSTYPHVIAFYTPLLKDFNIFSRLLNSSENLLVSAYGGAGGVYVLNTRTGEFQLLKRGSFRGTTLYKGKVLIANEHGDIYRINSINKGGFELLLKQNQRTNTHGILYWDELDLLFVTETLNDCLSVYEMDTFKKIEEIPLSSKSKHKGGNYHHVNDICLHDKKMYLSVISESGNFYNDRLDGVIYELDYKSNKQLRVVLENLIFPHAIQEVNNELLLLNSFNGDVLTIANKKIVNLPGFIRGMHSQEGLLYIGQSRHRRLDMAKKYFSGVSMDSGVYVVDPSTTTHRFVQMPEMCDIFNVRVL